MPIPLVCDGVHRVFNVIFFSFFLCFLFLFFDMSKEKNGGLIFWPCLANDFALSMQNS